MCAFTSGDSSFEPARLYPLKAGTAAEQRVLRDASPAAPEKQAG